MSLSGSAESLFSSTDAFGISILAVVMLEFRKPSMNFGFPNYEAIEREMNSSSHAWPRKDGILS